MSHLTCPKCNGTEHLSGYGFAGGVFGGYTICECGATLELFPDVQDLNDERAAELNAAAQRILAETWDDTAPAAQQTDTHD